MKNVTIGDIAAAAGVSKSTVSRVLNNSAGVHPEKRRAILEATRRLGFRPDPVARSLANGKSMTIGVLTQNIGSPFYDAISQGVIAGLNGTGYCAIFGDGQWRGEVEVEAIRALVSRRVDGLVLMGGEIPACRIEELCGDLPTIVVARRLPGDWHRCIFMDNVDGGYRATRHLIDLGHRAIAMIGGIAHHPDSIDRFEGYGKALCEAGIGVDPGLVVSGDFTAESGYVAVERLVCGGREFSAVFAANDMTAFGARLAFYRRGIRVPEDVSLVGFDDQAEAAFMAPPLTTVRQPAREMGVEASRAVLGLIEGRPFRSRTLRGELQTRESVRRIAEG